MQTSSDNVQQGYAGKALVVITYPYCSLPLDMEPHDSIVTGTCMHARFVNLHCSRPARTGAVPCRRQRPTAVMPAVTPYHACTCRADFVCACFRCKPPHVAALNLPPTISTHQAITHHRQTGKQESRLPT